MHYLLFIGAILAFAFIAPPRVTIAAAVLLLVVTTVIRLTTRAVAGTHASFGEAAKAVALSFFFLGIAFVMLISFSKGTGVSEFTGLSGLAVFAAFFAAYTVGFKVSLGLSVGASAVVATVSTLVSTALVVGYQKVG